VNEAKDNSRSPSGLTRRKFLRVVGLGGTALNADAEAAGATIFGPGAVPIKLSVNSVEHTLEVEPRLTLLEALRDRLGLTGTKRACNRGECGACTVLADGRPIYACSVLAVSAQAMEITTIEALASCKQSDPVGAAFIKHDALQCGVCTPGFLMALRALLSRNTHPGEDEVRLAMAGNLCQCGMYPRLIASVQEVVKAQGH